MKLSVLGCSGSVPVPGNPASGYLLSFPDAPSIILDLGPGTFAELQKLQDPCDAHVALTHLHADHCSDFPSLMVWRRFHPTAPAAQRNKFFGPSEACTRLGRVSADCDRDVDDMSDTFEAHVWREGVSERVDAVTITPYQSVHPTEAYALRIEDEAGRVLTYSGDSAYTDGLVPAARGADVFMCEAAWGETSAGKAGGMHMSGAEAGRLARQAGVGRLVLVHLQPWGDTEATVNAARGEFDGDITVARAGMSFTV